MRNLKLEKNTLHNAKKNFFEIKHFNKLTVLYYYNIVDSIMHPLP